MSSRPNRAILSLCVMMRVLMVALFANVRSFLSSLRRMLSPEPISVKTKGLVL